MERYGLLIDYNYCSGCRACEIACQMAHKSYGPDKQGLRVHTIGPFLLEDGKWQLDNLPLHTLYCNHCISRIRIGKKPACVHNCQSGCITFGTIDQLLPQMRSGKMVLYTV